MSGSGGGGSAPRARRRRDIDCMEFDFETTLEVVPGAPVHDPGTVLELLREDRMVKRRIIAVDDDGQEIGRVTQQTGVLNNCMDIGIAYVAVVTGVKLNAHKVRVRAADKQEAAGEYYIEIHGHRGTFLLGITDPDNFNAGVAAGENIIFPRQTCELRSLVRAGVELYGKVNDSGELSVPAP